MWKNEGRHVNELRLIDFCKNTAVAVNNADSLSEKVGRLVHFTETVTIDDDTLDLPPGSLNITSPIGKALAIRSKCTIYQKFKQASQHQQVKEDMVGAGTTTAVTYNVKEVWSSTRGTRFSW
jgi:hypothetical protein